jgi:putative membrane-bound dehydrogenase-like protein
MDLLERRRQNNRHAQLSRIMTEPAMDYRTVRVAAACLVLLAPLARAQRPPEETARSLQAADGLEVTLWAAEPMLVNPTNLDVDSRGRVWVTEGLNYRLTRAGNKQFHRIDDADKIKILSDTDGDGRADTVTVFADRIFPVPMGIAIEEHWSKDGMYEGCKVFVGNSPDLLVLEDTDGDDVADKRYPLLTGFGGIDSDHGVHGMTLGPDGKLYFTHGDGCCSVQQDHSERPQNFDVVDTSGRRVKTDQLGTVLRCDRDGSNLEILATRLRNDYECAVDSFGNIFVSDNDDDGNRGCRVVWILDGGVYGYRTPGSPRHWGEEVPGNIPKLVGTGNGSPCGIMVYEGGALGPEFDHGVFEVDAGTRQINWFPLKRVGAAFRTEAKVLLSGDDPNFRPVDVAAAPDGSLLVADWYDAGVGGHAFTDQSTGRIYRVAPKGAKPTLGSAEFATAEGLCAAFASPNVATRDAARRLLIERGPGDPIGDEAMRLSARRSRGDATALARVTWLAGQLRDDAIVASIREEMARRGPAWIGSPPEFREVVIRMLSSHGLGVAVDLDWPVLAGLVDDADAGVRRELILAMRDAATAEVGGALRKLAAAWDGQDRWYLEALGLALRHREPEFLASLLDGSLYGGVDAAEFSNGAVALPPYFPVDRNEAYLSVDDALPPASNLSRNLGLMWALKRVEALPRLVSWMPEMTAPELRQAADDIIAQVQDPAGAAIVAGLARDETDPARRRQLLATLARKLGGAWRPAAAEPAIGGLVEAAMADPATRAEGVALAGATGEARYAPGLMALAVDADAPAEARAAAVEAVAALKAPESGGLVDRLIDEARAKRAASPAAESAVRALPALGAAPERLRDLMTEEDLPLSLRREALRGFIQRREGAEALLAMARDGALSSALRTEAATALRSHADRGIRDRALEVFPIVSLGGKPLPSVGELMRREGDAERGREVFFRQASAGGQACASCHRVQGAGQWIGPDLSTIGTKYGKEELLRSILNPSAAIGYNYRALSLATRDGRTLTGLLVEETPERLVLKQADGARVVVPAAEIEERAQSDLSIMPEGLTETMSEQDLVDVLAYLATLRRPVSIAGRVELAGPLAGDAAARAGEALAWRRAEADAEGRVNLAEAGTYRLRVPLRSAAGQAARLVVDAPGRVAAWLDGRRLEPEPNGASFRLDLPDGAASLDLAVTVDGAGGVVTTVVADRPVEFAATP